MDKKYRTAIIGAGTCGLYLAWKLGQAGHKVMVFERKKDIVDVGQKACSALISETIKKFLPIGDSLIENRIDSCLLRFPRKTVVLKLNTVHLAINRLGLMEMLLGLAQGAGAEVLFGQDVKTAPHGFDKLIACDGALSNVRESVQGLSSHSCRPRMRLGLQVFEPKNRGEEDFSSAAEAWPVQDGFCWRIPRGGQVEYGALGPLRRVQNDFELFLQKQGLSPLLENGLKAALIPQGICLPRLTNITFCGDAAGMTKPWSGGGVLWGLTAADILLKTFPDFARYRQQAQRLFRMPLLKAGIALPLVYFLGDYLPFLLPSRMVLDNDFLP